jgi:hypothetical protein
MNWNEVEQKVKSWNCNFQDAPSEDAVDSALEVIEFVKDSVQPPTSVTAAPGNILRMTYSLENATTLYFEFMEDGSLEGAIFRAGALVRRQRIAPNLIEYLVENGAAL